MINYPNPTYSVNRSVTTERSATVGGNVSMVLLLITPNAHEVIPLTGIDAPFRFHCTITGRVFFFVRAECSQKDERTLLSSLGSLAAISA